MPIWARLTGRNPQPRAIPVQDSSPGDPVRRACEPPGRRVSIGLGILILGLVVLTYSNHFWNAFEFDDAHTIVSNAAIRDLRNIPRFFTDATTTSSTPYNQTYRPGTTTLNAIDFALAGGRLDPFVFHCSIFIAYLLLGGLLYLLYQHVLARSGGRGWSRLAALFAAGWFLLHAANAETVNYISQRADSFSTLMVVLALVIYLYRPGWRPYQVHLLPMAAGMLVKLPAVTFAPLLFVYVYLFESEEIQGRGRRALKALRAALPALLLGAALLLLASDLTPAYAVPAGPGRLNYLISQPFAVVHYIDNFFLPLQLSVDTDWRPLTTILDDRFFAGIGLLAALIAAAVYTARWKAGRPVAFGLVWFLLGLLPTSSVVPLDEVVNDHRTFLAYIGLVLAVSWAAGLGIQRHRALFERSTAARVALGCAAAALLLGHAWGAHQRNQVWATPASLWYDATLKSPANPRALMNYGLTQMEQGNLSGALDYYNRALALAPSYAYLRVNLGILYAAQGKPVEAEDQFRSALSLAPNLPEPYYYYARFLVNQGRPSEARSALAAALALSPGYLDAQVLAASLVPGDAYTTEINAGLAAYQAGDFLASLAAAQDAARLRPDSYVAYNNICAAANQLAHWEQAIRACQQALVLNPDFELARNNLQVAQQGQVNK